MISLTSDCLCSAAEEKLIRELAQFFRRKPAQLHGDIQWDAGAIEVLSLVVVISTEMTVPGPNFFPFRGFDLIFERKPRRLEATKGGIGTAPSGGKRIRFPARCR